MSRESVLIADDSAEFRELLRLVIGSLGVSVLEASDFTEAAAVARAEGDRIGLVLLDYFMPGDAAQAIAALREHVGSDRILLCTASDNAPRRAHELRIGGGLAKPIDLQALEEKVCTLCRR